MFMSAAPKRITAATYQLEQLGITARNYGVGAKIYRPEALAGKVVRVRWAVVLRGKFYN